MDLHLIDISSIKTRAGLNAGSSFYVNHTHYT